MDIRIEDDKPEPARNVLGELWVQHEKAEDVNNHLLEFFRE